MNDQKLLEKLQAAWPAARSNDLAGEAIVNRAWSALRQIADGDIRHLASEVPAFLSHPEDTLRLQALSTLCALQLAPGRELALELLFDSLAEPSERSWAWDCLQQGSGLSTQERQSLLAALSAEPRLPALLRQRINNSAPR